MQMGAHTARRGTLTCCGVSATIWVITTALSGARQLETTVPELVATVPQHISSAAVGLPPTVTLSADGRFLAFQSDSPLLPADTNAYTDVYVQDLRDGALVLSSQAEDGTAANGNSSQPGLSGDGRFVVFVSAATNLIQDRVTGRFAVYLRDLQSGTTRRISAATDGGAANNWSSSPVISADASSVTFESAATNLVDVPDVNGEVTDVYVFHRQTGRTERVTRQRG